MNQQSVLKLLEARIADAGSAKDLARRLGISETYLSNVRRGHQAPGPLLLETLGLERVVVYRRKGDGKA